MYLAKLIATLLILGLSSGCGGSSSNSDTPTQESENSIKNSSITGKVQDAISANPIEKANIQLSQNGQYLSSIQTDSLGIYTFSHLAGESGYSIQISKDDYLTVDYENITLDDNLIKHLETIMHIEKSYAGTGDIRGKIANSVDGNGIAGLLLELRKGINVHSGTVIRSTTTEDDGRYTISQLEAGNYTIEISADGYQRSYMTVVALGGRINEQQNGTINPILAEGEIRIVLTWGEKPSDLDSHLTGPIEGSSDRFHVYWMNEGSTSSTNLDVDDVSSYGPETITIRHQVSGIYRYSVHDYSNKIAISSSGLANSGANVKVYKGSGLFAEFFVPNEAGTLWEVFEIDGNNLTPINTMSYHSNEDTVQKMSKAKK